MGDDRRGPGPSGPGQVLPPPPPPPGPTIVRTDIVGPAEIAPGESVQLRANAVKSDGSVEDVTSQVVWGLYAHSTRSLQLSPTGLATGVEPGIAEVAARLGNNNTNKWIFVVPKGTFVLSGQPGQPLTFSVRELPRDSRREAHLIVKASHSARYASRVRVAYAISVYTA